MYVDSDAVTSRDRLYPKELTPSNSDFALRFHSVLAPSYGNAHLSHIVAYRGYISIRPSLDGRRRRNIEIEATHLGFPQTEEDPSRAINRTKTPLKTPYPRELYQKFVYSLPLPLHHVCALLNRTGTHRICHATHNLRSPPHRPLRKPNPPNMS